ncbi:DNA-directed RNA polymerases II, IV and V subunit 3 [Senna tora]|uniref:DNA-directed RNA polymerases II, IV and V subunit 3 n=1 Tax=Senna tora TaxID=362788 RepID=A0A835CFF7_9FABA|nr:DNA-directed RNA polymerases II, IV and V subunit 3 [Senna tora]
MERLLKLNRLMPRWKVLESRSRFLMFVLEGTTESFVRVLLRIMTEEVPTIAIHEVVIETNSSFLSDSFLAQRLRFIPLTSDLANLMYYSTECPNCNGRGYCHLCSVEFRLSAKCVAGDVTSKDLVTSNPSVLPFDFFDPTGTAIVKLKPGEELTLKAIARKGIGKDHIKWSPLAATSAKYFCPSDIRINEELMETLTLEQKKQWVASYPTDLFQVDPQTQKVVLCRPGNGYHNMPLNPEARGVIEVFEKKDTFVFTVETTGALKASQLLMNALAILKRKLLSFRVLEDHFLDHDLAGIDKLDSEN